MVKKPPAKAGNIGFDPSMGNVPWWREYTPVYLPGKFTRTEESYGLYSPWSRTELDITEHAQPQITKREGGH